MQFSPVLLAALPALAAAYYQNTTDVDVTTITKETVVTEFTTYCPEPTTIVTNNKTIIVETPTTITITDCPCTIETTITTTKGEHTKGGEHTEGEHTKGEHTKGPEGTTKGPEKTSAFPQPTPGEQSTKATVSTFEGAAAGKTVAWSLVAALAAALV